ncbi:MAG: NUDIX domain-containing protein [Candidatus Kerfeldbacteria bacterium]|nr:NUDIX domain-containing protein [Candidatus Kerfeldbacteria bacterium]
MKQEYSAGIIPVYQTGQAPYYLIVQHLGGHWGFPKGHLEFGENEIDAARRELREETGIKQCEPVDSTHWQEEYVFRNVEGQSIHKVVTYYLAMVRDQVVRLNKNELKAHRWMPYEEARQRLTYHSAREILTKANSVLIELNTYDA